MTYLGGNTGKTAKSVICLQNETDQIPKGCYGICSDWVGKYKR